MLPHCANFTILCQLGLAYASFARRLYRRSSLNWCFCDSLLNSGGHVRLQMYGLVSQVYGK